MHARGADGEPLWCAPRRTGAGRVPMRANFLAAPDAEGAASPRERHPWRFELNGRWRFRLLDSPDDAPERFPESDFDDRNWRDVDIPGCWPLQGWDQPRYLRGRPPFEAEPPEVPGTNPTALYRRKVRLPAGWHKRRVIMQLAGSESLVMLYINGERVGFTKDSGLPADFDVSRFLRPGYNCLALMVVRYSDASWLENRDAWWLAGLHRGIFLYTTAPTRFDDLRIDAGLDRSTGVLDVRADVAGPGLTRKNWRVRLSLTKPRGGEALKEPVEQVVSPVEADGDEPRTEVTLQARVPRVKPWTAETPELYRALVELLDHRGRVVEAASVRCGFRSVAVVDGRLEVNGRPVTLRGVIRHEHDPRHGQTLTADTTRDDLVAMKRYGFDAVWTARHGQAQEFYEICDELGLYVVDEAHVAPPEDRPEVLDLPEYEQAVIERAERLVARDRNHACVLAWSLGSATGERPVHERAAEAVRRADPTRPVLLPGAATAHWSAVETGDAPDDGAFASPASDLPCPRFATPAGLDRWTAAGDGPALLLSAYSRARGNANGSLVDYWQRIEASPRLQGGFVANWVDRGLYRERDDGAGYWAFGGDFDDEPNDANLCIDGLVWPDRTPKPALEEHRGLAVPLEILDFDAPGGRLRVRSRQDFRSTDWLDLAWAVTVEGKAVDEGRVRAPALAPGETGEVELGLGRPEVPEHLEVHLTVRVLVRAQEAWAPAGWELGVWQTPLDVEKVRRRSHLLMKSVARTESTDGLYLSRGDIEILMDAETAALKHIGLQGDPIVTGRLGLDLWRAPLDNDGSRLLNDAGDALQRWRQWGLEHLQFRYGRPKIRQQRQNEVSIDHNVGLATADGHAIDHHRRIVFGADGVLRFEETVTLPEEMDDLPRVGISFNLDGRCGNVAWFGRGPHENYPDRAAAAPLGRYRSHVDRLFTPYVLPQACGNRCETRWFALTDDEGRGILVLPPPEGGFSALPYDEASLEAARHVHDLESDDSIFVHVDRAQRGVGSASGGPDTLPAYRVGGGTWTWQWALRVLEPGEDAEDLAVRLRQAGGLA